MSMIFDIETTALPDEQLLPLLPEFTPPPHPGEFDPLAVKHGNTKDESKRAAKVADEYAKHITACENYAADAAAAKEKHWLEFKDRAALSATTGRVLAIGLYDQDESEPRPRIMHDDANEPALLANWWKVYRRWKDKGKSLVGFNSNGFDLPFLIRRSWILGVDVPATVIVQRRYFDGLFVDLRDVWLLGQKWGDAPSSLDIVSRALGAGCKADGGENVTGKDFGRLWLGTAEEREQATQYLHNDLVMTSRVATRLGVL